MRYILQCNIRNAATGNSWHDIGRFEPNELNAVKLMKERLDKAGKVVRIIAVIVDTEE